MSTPFKNVYPLQEPRSFPCLESGLAARTAISMKSASLTCTDMSGWKISGHRAEEPHKQNVRSTSLASRQPQRRSPGIS